MSIWRWIFGIGLILIGAILGLAGLLRLRTDFGESSVDLILSFMTLSLGGMLLIPKDKRGADRFGNPR